MGITVNNNQSTIVNQHFHSAGASESPVALQQLLHTQLLLVEKLALAEGRTASPQQAEAAKLIAQLRDELRQNKPDNTVVERYLQAMGNIGTLAGAIQPLRDLLGKVF